MAMSRERLRRAQIAMQLLASQAPHLVMSPVKATDLGVPVGA